MAQFNRRAFAEAFGRRQAVHVCRLRWLYFRPLVARVGRGSRSDMGSEVAEEGEMRGVSSRFSNIIPRVRAKFAAAPGKIVLTARTEGFIRGRPDLDETIRRLQAFAAAGADCLFAPGLRDEATIAAVVKVVAPKPVNVLTPGLSVSTLSNLGVRRISVGGGLARAAFGELLRAAREIAGEGTFSTLENGAPGRELNGLFSRDKGSES